MPTWIRNHGRAVGGMLGFATALSFAFNLNLLGMTLAVGAVVIAASAEWAKTPQNLPL